MPLDYSLPFAVQPLHLDTPEESQVKTIRLQQLKDLREQQVQEARDRVAIQQAFQQNVGADGLPNVHGILSALSSTPSAYQKVSSAFTKAQKDALDNEKLQNENDAARNTAFSQAIQGVTAENYAAQAPTLRQMFPDRVAVLGPTFDQGALDAARNAGTKHNDYLAAVKQANDAALDGRPTEGAAMQARALLASGAATDADVAEWQHKWQSMGVNPVLLRNGITPAAVQALEDATITPEKRAERAAAEAGRTQTAQSQQDLEKLRQAGAERLEGLRQQGRVALQKLKPVGGGAAAGTGADDAAAVAGAIIRGEQPPELTGLYSHTMAVRAELARQKYDLTRAREDWDATKKYLTTLNGAQQVRLRQAVNFAADSLDVVEQLNNQWKGGKFPLLNKVQLKAAKNGVLGPEAQSIATKLDAQISDLVSELGTVYKGGNSSTDESLKLAAENLQSDWSQKQLSDAIGLVRQNLQIRQNSIKNTSVIGGTPNNPYAPGASKTEAPADWVYDPVQKKLIKKGGG